MKSKFHHLSPSQKQTVFQLCDQHKYEDVVYILQQPAPDGGLQLQTSISALCRFYNDFHPDLHLHQQNVQFGHTLQLHRQANPGASLTGIVALLESRVLSGLRAGHAAENMTPLLRSLKWMHGLYEKDIRLRHACPKEVDAEYRQHMMDRALHPDADFVEITPENIDLVPQKSPDFPVIPPNSNPTEDQDETEYSPEDFDELSAEDRAIDRALVEFKEKDIERVRKGNFLRYMEASLPFENARLYRNTSENPPKTPQIPMIPPNSTPVSTPENPSQPEPAQAEELDEFDLPTNYVPSDAEIEATKDHLDLPTESPAIFTRDITPPIDQSNHLETVALF